jgi:predicted MFS family arabinose efflux permease
MTERQNPNPVLAQRQMVGVFLAFAFAYFLSTLMRAITATLSPALTQELSLSAQDLGLLAGGYFLGFSATQLPLGKWLDRYGPKTVILCFLIVAVLGCAAFAMAQSFVGLWMARFLCGVGVSACLMAPLTGYRRWMDAGSQLRANSWMLMTGSLGMLSSTLPVQWLMPVTGWRAIFAGLAVLVVLAMVLIYKVVPVWETQQVSQDPAAKEETGYGPVWRNAYFWRMAPVGFFCYAGMLAVQTLWAGPWMTVVGGYTPLSAATGLFAINLSMLLTFWIWGLITPRLSKRGISANKLIAWGQPLSFAVLFGVVWLGPDLGGASAAALALFCMTSTFVALAQPAVGMAFPSHLAGRALSAYNLVIFVGVFVVQWGIGVGIDFFKSLGWPPVLAFQAAFSVFGFCAVLSYVYFHWANRDNSA